MIKGIGVDIIDIARIKEMVNKNRRFVQKIFSEYEIEYCESKSKKEIHYAARFAAKEAFLKALGTGWRHGIKWTDMAVENDELGKPRIKLEDKAKDIFKEMNSQSISLSISHTKEYAVAFVVIE
jgi:holo-[acyl-carrier protein] synthase